MKSNGANPPLLPDPGSIERAGDLPANVAAEARSIAPVVWLIGKVQSGKSSIVRAITQSSAAEVGLGFKACTRTASVFDFPADVPILRFLDTRGLGEADYDPGDDLAFAERQAHLLLVTMRAMDMAQEAVVATISQVRQRHPEWPVVVAQTCLHEGYSPQDGHVLPYPFSIAEPDRNDHLALPHDLRRCLRHQRSLFAALPGHAPPIFVPLDITRPDDGFSPVEYGLDELADALVRAAPAAMRVAIQALPGIEGDGRKRAADPVIVGHAMAAAGSDLVPAAGAVAVSAVQARLLQRIGQIYGVSWDRRTLAEFAAALGSGVVARTLVGFGIRQIAKLIPAYGQTVAAATSAAMSFAVTYALGKSAVYFLTQRQRGLRSDETATVYQDALRQAMKLAKERKLQTSDRPAAR
jgi:uncharacterized protein (DUF697 family)